MLIEERQNAMDRFVGSVWRLTTAGGNVVAPILRLLQNGIIGGYGHPAQRCWAVRGGRMLFLDSDGVVTTIFDAAEDVDGETTRFTGHIRHETNVKLVLERTPMPNPLKDDGTSQWRSARFLEAIDKPRRENLVVICANDKSLHTKWPQDFDDIDRNWDLCVTRYDAEPTVTAGAYEYLAHQPREPKFIGLHNLFYKGSPLWNYRYIWLPDDDLMTSRRSVNRLFEICNRHQLMLAQPSLKVDSHVNHYVTRQDPRFALRFSKFVEIMCPVFSQEALRICIPTFRNVRSGYGLDHIWPKLIGAISTRIAIIDAVAVAHTRPLGTNYDLESAIREGLEMQKLYNAPDEYASVGCLLESETALL